MDCHHFEITLSGRSKLEWTQAFFDWVKQEQLRQPDKNFDRTPGACRAHVPLQQQPKPLLYMLLLLPPF
jgi:hypothetical protein